MGGRESVWRERGYILVKTVVQVQSDFVNRPSEGDGGVSKGGRDPGREGMSGSGRKGYMRLPKSVDAHSVAPVWHYAADGILQQLDDSFTKSPPPCTPRLDEL